MIYSGADLIRTSGQQQDRVERLRLADRGDAGDAGAVEPVSSPENPASGLDENTQGALLRFARFLHGRGGSGGGAGQGRADKKRSPISKSDNPYIRFAERLERMSDGGQILDLYI
jgi:hypothetical protein